MRQVSAAGLIVLAAIRCYGQDPVYSKDAAGRVTVRATRIAAAIKIDGRLDEDVYTQVEALTTFIQSEPQQGAPVSERTEAWVLFDDDNLYLACRCWDQHPERMIANE